MHRRHVILNNSGLSAQDDYMSIDVFQRHSAADKIAFVFHGRNGNSNSPHLLKMIEPYLAKNYMVISPNLCHSDWNDSAGNGKDFLIGHHVRDCARTIEWAKTHRDSLGWNGREMALCGHSMGGYAACFLAATRYNACTTHVLAVAPFVDGYRQIEAREKYHPDGIEALKRECTNALDDWPKHSLFAHARNLHMPVSAVVGVNDNLTLPADIADFFDLLPNGKSFLVLEGEHHCIVGDRIPAILGECIHRLENPPSGIHQTYHPAQPGLAL